MLEPARKPICERMLMRRTGIRFTYMAFDLLTLDGQDLTGSPEGSPELGEGLPEERAGPVGKQGARSVIATMAPRRW